MTPVTFVTANHQADALTGSGQPTHSFEAVDSLSRMSSVSSPNTQNELEWYKRSDVLQALLAQLVNREVWVSAENYVSPRPRAAKGDSDLLNLMPTGGICSVYASIESFSNPLLLATEKVESLRVGWDFVLDVDSSLGLGEAKRCTKAILGLLRNYDVHSVRVKFSGRRGFHVLMDGEAFDCFASRSEFLGAYPIVPLQVARFIVASLRPNDRRGVEIDAAIYTPRHLIRIAYSLHHKSGLVSLPLAPDAIEQFNLEATKPVQNVDVDWDWLKPKARPMEASKLLDYVAKWLQRGKPNRRGLKVLTRRLHKAFSRSARNPPCVQTLLKEGFSRRLEGHRNRVLFAVLTGIRRLNFAITPGELEELNMRSERPLPERELQYQISYHMRRPHAYPFRCEIMQSARLCPPQKCPIGRFMRER